MHRRASLIFAGAALAIIAIGVAIGFALDRPPPKSKTIVESQFGKHILIRPEFLGQNAGWFMLDTGATDFVVTATTARSLNLQRIGASSASGFGGAFVVNRYLVPSCRIGIVGIHNAKATEIPDRRDGISGIVGNSLMRGSVLVIDGPNQTVEVLDPRGWGLETRDWLPATESHGVLLVDCLLDGHPCKLSLDTGANAELVVNSWAAEKFGLLKGRETTASMGSGVRGDAFPIRKGKIAALKLGHFTFRNLPTDFLIDASGAEQTPVAGVIGLPLLRKFKVVFDHPRLRVAILKP